jgi:hypothetical protein
MSDRDGWVEIVLVRVTGGSPPLPYFMFKGELVDTLTRFNAPQIWNNIKEDGGGSRIYNFNLGINSVTFNRITECLRTLEINLQRLQYSI